MTTAERLYQAGFRKGYAEGFRQGLREVRADGALRVLTSRFGTLSVDDLKRFEALDLAGLAAIFEGIFDARSIDHALTQAEQVDAPPHDSVGPPPQPF